MHDVLQASYGCSVELTLDLIGGKWKTVILAHLKESPLRYGELRARISKVSDKMLTQRLHELTDLGFVEAHEVSGRRTYRLTPRGDSLRPVLQALHDWGRAVADEHSVKLDH